jgi:hypothetical protein
LKLIGRGRILVSSRLEIDRRRNILNAVLEIDRWRNILRNIPDAVLESNWRMNISTDTVIEIDLRRKISSLPALVEI